MSDLWLQRNGEIRRGPAREVLADMREREGKAVESEWHPHRDGLTPKEKARIVAGNYHSFRRPIKPEFTAGTWLEVRTAKLKVRIAAVEELYKGNYRIRIDRVWDDRSNGPRIKAYQRNEEGRIEPEKDGVDKEWLRRFAEEAAMKEADWIREAIRG